MAQHTAQDCRMTDDRNQRLETVVDDQAPGVSIKYLCKFFILYEFYMNFSLKNGLEALL
jgi:hypothetical protein